MASKALAMTGVRPKLVYRLEGARAIEVWTTVCIVSSFQEAKASVLINPGNPQLSGVAKFPYFPRGGPVPKAGPTVSPHHIMGFVSQWGGMEVGDGMLFPVSVVDGLVHLHGGWRLEAECSWKRIKSRNGEACPIGEAVETSAGRDKLSEVYDRVVHTTPPFYRHDKDPLAMLSKCYKSSLDLAFSGRTCGIRVASPLLGAGARGFPTDMAMQIAVESCIEWQREENNPEIIGNEDAVVFGLLEAKHAEDLAELFEREK